MQLIAQKFTRFVQGCDVLVELGKAGPEGGCLLYLTKRIDHDVGWIFGQFHSQCLGLGCHHLGIKGCRQDDEGCKHGYPLLDICGRQRNHALQRFGVGGMQRGSVSVFDLEAYDVELCVMDFFSRWNQGIH